MASLTVNDPPRDHGGGLDAAIAQWGGARDSWIDLSTGINPTPYPLPVLPAFAWTGLPDANAATALTDAARKLWQVPDDFAVLPTHGASAAIARLPALLGAAPGTVDIPAPTYNEHAAAFAAAGWTQEGTTPDVRVIVNPNNPDGRYWQADDLTAPFTIIDESFCDIAPERSLLDDLDPSRGLVLKSFGKFWGLAGLRLGFVIAAPDLIAQLSESTGPWSVSGPAHCIGTQALGDRNWANKTRTQLTKDAATLDGLLTAKGGELVGGTPLFRLYRVDDAAAWQDRLARGHVWSRIFPYSRHWLRLGLPAAPQWAQVEAAV